MITNGQTAEQHPAAAVRYAFLAPLSPAAARGRPVLTGLSAAPRTLGAMRVPILGRRLYSALMFVLVSVLGGVLMAGLMVPAAGIAAETGKMAATALNALPEELKVGPPAEGSKVLMADGKTVLTSFYDQYRRNVSIDDIAPIMRQAQVGIEDQRFYEHGALDLRGTLRALVRSSSGQTQGGSTLTQQYVKLALLYDAAARNDTAAIEAANSRTISRKILELRYAVALEKQLTKDQILERYLNIAFFGDKAYGVEAAAQHYFGVPAKNLTLPQAAMLAGIVRNPVTTNPIRNVAAASERMRNVIDRLAELNIITPDEATQAKAYKFDASKVKKIEPRGCSVSPYPHLCDYVEQVLLEQTPSLGSDQQTRRNTLNQAGLTILTNIDPRFQDAAQAAVSNFVAPTDPIIGIMTLVQPGTGRILAMAQSKPEIGADTAKGQTFLNYAVSSSMNGAGGSEGGSTFKAYTLTAALLAGVDPMKDTIDSPTKFTFPRGSKFGTCTGAATGADFSPSTATSGTYNMYQGATYSSNTYFTQLEQRVGVCNVVKAAEALGLKRADGANLLTGILPDGKRISGDLPDGEKPTFTLGNSPATPLSMANTYATLAARGKRCDPVILSKISDTKSREYAVPSSNCTQVIPPEVADRVNDILHGPFSVEGTAEKAAIPGYLVSGKTGTTTGTTAVLTAGYTPDIAGQAIITSDPKHPSLKGLGRKPSITGLVVHGADIEVSNSMGNSFDHYSTNSGYTIEGRSGTEAGGAIWKPTMLAVLPLLPKTAFVRPADSPYTDAGTNSDITSSMVWSTGAVQPAPETTTQAPRTRTSRPQATQTKPTTATQPPPTTTTTRTTTTTTTTTKSTTTTAVQPGKPTATKKSP